MSTAALAIRPLDRPPDAAITVPGSKSITNRVLLLAALADGTSELSGVLFSDDTRYMVEALRTLGVAVDIDEANARIVVRGCAGSWPVEEARINVGNAGTAMRFLVAGLCVGSGRYTVDGSARMRERPIGELVEALRQLGAKVRCTPAGTPPVVVQGGGLRGGTAVLSAERSSQFLSGLLMVAPYAEGDVTIRVRDRVVAEPYVDMTVGVMMKWGIAFDSQHPFRREFFVRGRQRYIAQPYAVEPDASSAHYFWAAAALTGGKVRVKGVGYNSIQGDVRFAKLLEEMGAVVEDPDGESIAVRGVGPLRGIAEDLNAFSDTVPTLAAIAPFATGPVHIRNVAHLRWQESNRLSAVATELGRLGVRVEERDDGLTVFPSTIKPASVQTYDDHRIAMAFALVGLKVPGIQIENPGCVAKTFPDYFARLEALRR